MSASGSRGDCRSLPTTTRRQFQSLLYNPAKATVLYRPAKINGANVVVNPIYGSCGDTACWQASSFGKRRSAQRNHHDATTPGFPKEMVFSNGILTAPRFGLAWTVRQRQDGIRAGGGFFYNPGADAGTLGNLFFNPPAIYNPVEYYGTVATAANGTGLLSPSSFSRDIDLITRSSRRITPALVSRGILAI